VGDAEALATALKRLIENPKLRVRMGDNSRMVAASKFSIDSILEQYLEVYRKFGILDAGSTVAGA
jgi:glycosyltransferase involved in cell wall biosynthesis